jgi:hypothetical protein
MDIIVTTPKSASADAAQEAENVKKSGGGSYYRRLGTLPKDLQSGDKVFYVEDGFVRGYAVVHSVLKDTAFTCSTTNKTWPRGNYVVMPAVSWKWINPIEMRGFQSWRYAKFKPGDITVVGNWLDPKP